MEDLLVTVHVGSLTLSFGTLRQRILLKCGVAREAREARLFIHHEESIP